MREEFWEMSLPMSEVKEMDLEQRDALMADLQKLDDAFDRVLLKYDLEFQVKCLTPDVSLSYNRKDTKWQNTMQQFN